jgi:probable F420-dependent oxidoreductase
VSGRPLKVGVQLPEIEYVVRWPELVAMAQAAESAGFDSLWVGDHLLYRYPDGRTKGPWEAWTTLAGLAAVTRRIELGPLVAATSFHSPPMLAKLATTVDEISGGRLILGLGAGWNEPDYSAFGFPFDRRAARFEEAFTIIRALVREGEVDFDGRFYQARECVLLPRGPRPAGPPLMIGSLGPRVLRAALPHVDAWNAWYAWFGNDVERLGGLLAAVDETCVEMGRDPAEVERTVTVLVRTAGGHGRDEVDEHGRSSRPLAGPAEQIADGLRAFAALGIGHVQLVVDPITRTSIEQLAPVLALLDAD